MDWLHAYFHPDTRGLPETTSLEAARTLTMLILGELLASAVLKRKVYSLRQTINNLASSMLAQVLFGTFLKTLNLLPYRWVHTHYSLLDWPAQHLWALHLLAFLYCDLGHYTMHRFLHAHNLTYSMHAVHHSSPDYNFSVGVRLSMTESAVDWVLYLPLALVCPPAVFLAHRTTSVALQALTHTELVGKLWWPIELVCVTPSHHRVHHSRNYGQKNYGGLLIIWDRLLGTFQEEKPTKRPVYGLNEQAVPQGTYNPMWHQLGYFVGTLRLATSGKVPLWSALWSRTSGPGMVYSSRAKAAKGGPSGAVQLVASAASPARVGREDAQGSLTGDQWFPWESRALTSLDAYAALSFLLVHVPCTLVFLKATPTLSTAVIIGGAAFSMWTTTTLAWLCGGQRQAVLHEIFRLAVQASAGGCVYQSVPLSPLASWMAVATVGMSLAAAIYLLSRSTKTSNNEK